MPLYVGDKQVTEIHPNLLEFNRSHELLSKSTQSASDQVLRNTPGKNLIYVCQREYAVVSPDDKFIDIIGSEDATTCHLLALRHTGSGVSGLGHLDGLKTKAFIQAMIKDVCQLSVGGPEGRLEVHIYGGFLDDHKESIKLSKSILKVFMNESQDLYLMTFFCSDLNDVIRDHIHFPIVYGIGINVKTGDVFPSKFPDRGPDMDIRGALCFAGYNKIHNIYDSKRQLLVVGPYSWKPSPHAAQYAALPDEIIRQYMSTSPEQEPDYFVTHVRTAYQALHAHPEPHKTLFKNNSARMYRKNDEDQWERVAAVDT